MTGLWVLQPRNTVTTTAITTEQTILMLSLPLVGLHISFSVREKVPEC